MYNVHKLHTSLLYAAMLSPVHESMDRSRFASLPNTTNAVEAYNRISKSCRGPEALQVALLTLYKKLFFGLWQRRDAFQPLMKTRHQLHWLDG